MTSSSPLEAGKTKDGPDAALDDEHYMDQDMVKNGQTISNTKILPSMSEDENPFQSK